MFDNSNSLFIAFIIVNIVFFILFCLCMHRLYQLNRKRSYIGHDVYLSTKVYSWLSVAMICITVVSNFCLTSLIERSNDKAIKEYAEVGYTIYLNGLSVKVEDMDLENTSLLFDYQFCGVNDNTKSVFFISSDIE